MRASSRTPAQTAPARWRQTLPAPFARVLFGGRRATRFFTTRVRERGDSAWRLSPLDELLHGAASAGRGGGIRGITRTAEASASAEQARASALAGTTRESAPADSVHDLVPDEVPARCDRETPSPPDGELETPRSSRVGRPSPSQTRVVFNVADATRDGRCRERTGRSELGLRPAAKRAQRNTEQTTRGPRIRARSPRCVCARRVCGRLAERGVPLAAFSERPPRLHRARPSSPSLRRGVSRRRARRASVRASAGRRRAHEPTPEAIE